MAQAAPGWCDPVLRNHPIERFVSRTGIFDTKRSNDDLRVIFQTTPVPLRGTSPPDLRRGARKTSNLQVPAKAGMTRTRLDRCLIFADSK